MAIALLSSQGQQPSEVSTSHGLPTCCAHGRACVTRRRQKTEFVYGWLALFECAFIYAVMTNFFRLHHQLRAQLPVLSTLVRPLG
jgi:hypothetical protein